MVQMYKINGPERTLQYSTVCAELVGRIYLTGICAVRSSLEFEEWAWCGPGWPEAGSLDYTLKGVGSPQPDFVVVEVTWAADNGVCLAWIWFGCGLEMIELIFCVVVSLKEGHMVVVVAVIKFWQYFVVFFLLLLCEYEESGVWGILLIYLLACVGFVCKTHKIVVVIRFWLQDLDSSCKVVIEVGTQRRWQESTGSRPALVPSSSLCLWWFMCLNFETHKNVALATSCSPQVATRFLIEE